MYTAAWDRSRCREFELASNLKLQMSKTLSEAQVDCLRHVVLGYEDSSLFPYYNRTRVDIVERTQTLSATAPVVVNAGRSPKVTQSVLNRSCSETAAGTGWNSRH